MAGLVPEPRSGTQGSCPFPDQGPYHLLPFDQYLSQPGTQKGQQMRGRG